MDDDKRHLVFPAMDIRYKDPFFLAEEIKKLQTKQNELTKINEGLKTNVEDLAGEVLHLRTALTEEREQSSKSREETETLSANLAKALAEIQSLSTRVKKLEGNVAENENSQLSSERNRGHEPKSSEHFMFCIYFDFNL